MKKILWVAQGIIITTVLLSAGVFAIEGGDGKLPAKRTVTQQITSLQELPAISASFKAPSFEKPDWYKKQTDDEKRASAAVSTQALPSSGRVVTYSVGTRGQVSSDLATFSAEANQTLNDPRGWARLGVSFKEIPSGGQFSLLLTSPSVLGSVPGCGAEWSCRSGTSVMINDTRWTNASTSWNQAGGNLRDYRHMVVNHEVGHWLGHGHLHCSAAGALAPIMQQQSISLEGCTFNPWPQASELWSTTLGIK